MRHLFPALATILAALIIAGCSGGSPGPLEPGQLQPDTLPAGSLSSPAASGGDASEANRTLWGYWQCSYDEASGRIVAVPARTGMLHLNVVGPLNKSLGIGVQLDPAQSNPAEGLFVLTVGLTHPYGGSPQLAAFDVRGILITTAGLSAGDMRLPGPSDPYIIDADGYTRWWNPNEFPVPGLYGYTPGILGKNPPPDNPLASTINPYMQFADGLYKSYPVSYLTFIPIGSPNWRGVFRAGATNSRVYKIQFPLVGGKPKVFFNYAVDASYVAPTGPNIPNDFPHTANCPEAFIVNANVTGNSLFGVDGAPVGGGELDLDIECWDWQGWMDGYDGQVGPLVLISPGIEFQTGIQPDVQVSSTGKATLTATIPGLPMKTGEVPVWIGVTAPGTSYDQGIKPAPSEVIAAFTLVTVDVMLEECSDNGNSNCSSAVQIGQSEQVSGMLCLDVDPSDWYNFTVPDGGSASGSIVLTSFGISNLSLFLLKDCPATPIMGSVNPGNMDEDLTLNSLEPGDYYIEVACATDGNYSPRPYSMTTSITGLGEGCTVDSNNVATEANPIALDGSVSETVCPVNDPQDWFTFAVSPDSTAYGTIDLLNNDYANNDIFLYDESLGAPLYSGDLPGNVDEQIVVDSLSTGTYYVEVRAVGPDPTGDRPFDLNMALVETSVSCDDSDGNNTWSEATPIGLTEEVSGTVCFPSDPDWYGLDVPLTGVDGSITLGNLGLFDNDIAVYSSPAADPIYESSTVGTEDEVINVDALPVGPWYIKVTASSSVAGVNQQYTLTTALVPHGENPTNFYLHVFIVRTTQGGSPATTQEIVDADVAWADEFWGKWADGSVTLSETSYINRTQWLSLTTSEAMAMFNQYGDTSGVLNVFYVNDTPDMSGAAAYTWMDCEYAMQSHDSSFIIMTDYSDTSSLAHEMGHAIGLLGDMYLLDFYTCDDITYCSSGPSGVFCLESDANWGNIMYWSIGEDIDSYWASDTDKGMTTPEIDSQVENIMYFNVNYPDAFTAP